ncbi:hypothetical protein [Streptomyces sp. bgisy084]|uniref:hypothetical protein n=1 Tax=Streptomyces sp. bgisy084 TaxID=3413777 RepID=UPI003D71BC66
MSVDAPEPPPPPEIPETRDNGSSEGDDEPGHTTMEDIDAADSSSSGPEGDAPNNDASDGPQEPADGDGETANPGADADGSDGPEDPDEPADSGSAGHDLTRHTAAEDMDAVDDTDDGVHDGDVGSHPLQSEDPLSAPADDGAAIGPDPGVPESQEKRSAESNGADEESSLSPETAVDEELAVPEKDAEATRRESDEDVTGKPPEEPNGTHRDTEEPTDRPEPTDTSVAGQDNADSRLAEAGEPDDAQDPLEVTEPEEPFDAGDPAETAVTDATAAHSDAGDVLEHRDQEEDASDSDDDPDPSAAADPTDEGQARETSSPEAPDREAGRTDAGKGADSLHDRASGGTETAESPRTTVEDEAGAGQHAGDDDEYAAELPPDDEDKGSPGQPADAADKNKEIAHGPVAEPIVRDGEAALADTEVENTPMGRADDLRRGPDAGHGSPAGGQGDVPGSSGHDGPIGVDHAPGSAGGDQDPGDSGTDVPPPPHEGGLGNPGASLPDGSWVGEIGLHLDREANAAADDFIRRSAEAEPRITEAMQGIAGKVDDGKLLGLEYRLKGEGSLKRKLATDLLEDIGMDHGQALSDIKDSIRYTMEVPSNGYTHGVQQAINDLQAKGFENVTFKNTWDSAGYKGINSTWRDPASGKVFELQFHTADSFTAKMDGHILYETERLPGVSPEEISAIKAEQAELFGKVPVPHDAGAIRIDAHGADDAAAARGGGS